MKREVVILRCIRGFCLCRRTPLRPFAGSTISTINRCEIPCKHIAHALYLHKLPVKMIWPQWALTFSSASDSKIIVFGKREDGEESSGHQSEEEVTWTIFSREQPSNFATIKRFFIWQFCLKKIWKFWHFCLQTAVGVVAGLRRWGRLLPIWPTTTTCQGSLIGSAYRCIPSQSGSFWSLNSVIFLFLLAFKMYASRLNLKLIFVTISSKLRQNHLTNNTRARIDINEDRHKWGWAYWGWA